MAAPGILNGWPMLGVLDSERRTMRSLPPQTAGLAGGLALIFSLMVPTVASQSPAASSGCHITGRAQSGTRPLPGVSIMAMAGDTVKGATSSDPDGTFSLHVPPASTYTLKVELMGFTGVEPRARRRSAALRPEDRARADARKAGTHGGRRVRRVRRVRQVRRVRRVRQVRGARGRGLRRSTSKPMPTPPRPRWSRRRSAKARRPRLGCCCRRDSRLRARPKRSPSTAAWRRSIAA